MKSVVWKLKIDYNSVHDYCLDGSTTAGCNGNSPLKSLIEKWEILKIVMHNLHEQLVVEHYDFCSECPAVSCCEPHWKPVSPFNFWDQGFNPSS